MNKSFFVKICLGICFIVFCFYNCQQRAMLEQQKQDEHDNTVEYCAAKFKEGVCEDVCMNLIRNEHYSHGHTSVYYCFSIGGQEVPCHCFANIPSGLAPLKCINEFKK